MLLKTATHTKSLTIEARDGEIGKVQDLYFDDQQWTIRYLIVNTSNWLTRYDVLISPMFVQKADWDQKQLKLSLTKEQIKNSPNIDTQKPVSRQQEADYQRSFGAPQYWGGSYAWGVGPFPTDLMAVGVPLGLPAMALPDTPGDSHLRSTNAVTGYHVAATDGEIGHIEDFLLDEETWTIRYLPVVTRNWLPGKKVLLAPEWVQSVDWADADVKVGLSRETIQSAPEYIESRGITREYENLLHEHYGRPPYWTSKFYSREA